MKANQKDPETQQKKKAKQKTLSEKANNDPSQNNPSTEDTIGDEEKRKKTKMPEPHLPHSGKKSSQSIS
ncbi:MAG: hypothetical protein ABI315_04470 [Bacteroidia bacterium]